MSGSEKNGTWTKVALAVMGAVSLLSVGFAASSSTIALDYRRIDCQGTQMSQDLQRRVDKLETTVDVTMKQVQKSMDDLTSEFRRHTTVLQRSGE